MPRITLRPGLELDGFVLGDILHRGGMAEIWSVTKAGITGKMVMKVPMIFEGDDPTMIVSFEQEMTILPRLSGPHVPRIFGIGDFATQPYIVMEQLQGESLLARFHAAPIPLDEVIATGARVADALASLHRQDVVRLDLKPSNIMFRTPASVGPDGRLQIGEAVFIDFGLSRHLKLPDLMAEEFRVPMGTAPYIAPEQVMKIREEPRSDIFALGVLLYALATGKRPFGNPKHTTKALMRRFYEAPDPPRALRPEIPGYLQEPILRLLEVKPEKRYPNAEQVAFDLRHPEHIVLTDRARREKTHRLRNLLSGRLPGFGGAQALTRVENYRHAVSAPIIMVAVDLSEEGEKLNEPLRDFLRRLLVTSPDSRLACVNVLRTKVIGIDEMTEADGSSKHVRRLVDLRHWAEAMRLPPEQITFHVLESSNPAEAMQTFARNNHVGHIVVGARGSGGVRRYLGSVSTALVAEAPCDVTVIRMPEASEHEAENEKAGEANAAPA